MFDQIVWMRDDEELQPSLPLPNKILSSCAIGVLTPFGTLPFPFIGEKNLSSRTLSMTKKYRPLQLKQGRFCLTYIPEMCKKQKLKAKSSV